MLWDKTAHMEDSVLIVNTIHDSVIAEVRDDKIKEYVELARQCFTEDIYVMLDRLYGMKFDVPLGMSAKAGKHWGEGEETNSKLITISSDSSRLMLLDVV